MPRYTLLDMVQTVLSDLNEDLVNSLDDTQTADQVARIIRDSYYHLYHSRLWPHTSKLTQLTPSTDSNFPTHLRLPDNVTQVMDLRYNTKDEITDATGLDHYKSMVYLTPEEMLDLMQERNPANANVTTVVDTLSSDGVKLFILTDKDPQYWTSFDDEWLVFDSYDSSFDDTLQNQKTMCLAYVEPPFLLEDDFVPDLPSKAFSLLLSESKKAAFIKLKQTMDPVENERARKQRTWLAGEKHRRRDTAVSYPNYGRK